MAYKASNIIFEARFKCSIPSSISHKPLEGRFKYNISLVWYMAYRTENIQARFFRYMANRTRNIFTFEARFLRFMAYRTGSVTFEARLFRFMHIE